MNILYLSIALIITTILAFVVLIPILFRVVVETNKVHIVQTGKKTISYGAGQAAGNVYYSWYSWIPVIGVTKIELPVSNFNLPLEKYHAYDKERVPFELDLTAFFHIKDTNKAAERISNFEDLKKQLTYIVQGAARKILSSYDIHQIMTDRATFGEQFTLEVKSEVENWGVETVKNMELMDIRDTGNSNVIANIMAKKASHIEMEARVEVAKNRQISESAEIQSELAIDLSRQEKEQTVGERVAAQEKAVGIAQQKSLQEIKEQEALTAEKQMQIERVQQVKQAEISKDTAVVNAEQEKQVAVLRAEGQLEATKRIAEGIQTEGKAKAAAEQAMQMAPVEAQIALAKEIGENQGYQQYLVSLKTVEASVAVGIKQAEAISAAELKIIANAGNINSGVNTITQAFSSQGGTQLGSMLEGLAQFPQGAEILSGLNKLLNKTN